MHYRSTAAVLATIVAGFMFCCTPKMDVGLGKAKGFSADITVKAKMGGRIHVTKGRIFSSKNGNNRMEMLPHSITIMRMDKNLIWLMMPTQKKYMEHSLKAENAFYGGGQVPGEISREMVGEEVIDGQQTKKYKIKYTAETPRGKKDDIMYQWIAVDTGIPIKMSLAGGGISYEYKNVELGSQPADIFELPAGYTKLAMP